MKLKTEKQVNEKHDQNGRAMKNEAHVDVLSKDFQTEEKVTR